MISVNKAIIHGNLGNNPKIVKGQGDKEFAFLSVATTENYKDKKGGWQSKTEWHSVTIFISPLVSLVKEYLKKGDQIYLEGSLSTSKYKDDSGKEQFRTQIIISSPNHILQFNSKKEDDKEAEKENVKKNKKKAEQ